MFLCSFNDSLLCHVIENFGNCCQLSVVALLGNTLESHPRVTTQELEDFRNYVNALFSKYLTNIVQLLNDLHLITKDFLVNDPDSDHPPLPQNNQEGDSSSMKLTVAILQSLVDIFFTLMKAIRWIVDIEEGKDNRMQSSELSDVDIEETKFLLNLLTVKTLQILIEIRHERSMKYLELFLNSSSVKFSGMKMSDDRLSCGRFLFDVVKQWSSDFKVCMMMSAYDDGNIPSTPSSSTSASTSTSVPNSSILSSSSSSLSPSPFSSVLTATSQSPVSSTSFSSTASTMTKLSNSSVGGISHEGDNLIYKTSDILCSQSHLFIIQSMVQDVPFQVFQDSSFSALADLLRLAKKSVDFYSLAMAFVSCFQWIAQKDQENDRLQEEVIT